MEKQSLLAKNRVCVCLTGDHLERFLNLCQGNGITIYKLQKNESGLFCEMKTSDFFCVKKYLRKSGCRMKVVEKKGIYFVCKRNRDLLVLLALFCLFLCLILGIGQRIWKIEIHGVTTPVEQEIMESLKEDDITIGSKRKDILCEILEEKIRDEIKELTWVSVSMDGVKLSIECKQNLLKAPELKFEESGYAKNVVCPHDGIIKSIYVRNGTPMVKVEDQVFQGQIVVSGQVTIPEQEEMVISYCADADYELQYQEQLLLKETYQYENEQETGKKVYYPYFIWNHKKVVFDFPQCQFTDFREETIEKEYCFSFFGKTVSIEMGMISLHEITKTKECYTKQELRERLTDQMIQKLANLEEKGVQIIEKNVTIESNYEGMTCICELTLRELISSARMEYGAISDGF